LAIWLGGRLGVGQRRAALVAVVASVTSHPVLWFAGYPVWRDALGDVAGLLIAEAGVTVWEAAVWRIGTGLAMSDALTIALATNAASLGLGLLLGLALP
jgi:hypothetical protein